MALYSGELQRPISALLQAKDPDTSKSFSIDQLVSEAGLLTIAGSDTTITATTATFFYLLHYPSCFTRVEEEIRSAFTDVEDIRIGSRLSACHFLLACIEESLRLTPPVGSTLMREVLPGGLTVDGELFPPGTYRCWCATLCSSSRRRLLFQTIRL